MCIEKKDLFEKSLVLHRALAKKFGYEVSVRLNSVASELVETQKMNFDKVSPSKYESEYSFRYDYVRYREAELAAAELRQNVHEDFSKLSVAEAGVYQGAFAWIIERLFPECDLYLYDTFEGFDDADMKKEVADNYTSSEYLKSMKQEFGGHMTSQQLISAVKSKLNNPAKANFRQGHFPETARGEKDKKWLFVSLDMDLYKPILDGILFFYPNLVRGGTSLCMITII